MRALALAALAGATGCSNLLGLDDPQLADAGTGDPDAPIDGPDIDAPSNTVTGRMYNRHISAAGPTETPIDGTPILIQALIPDGNEPTGFRTVTGTGAADGTFVIDEVPDGITYLLKIGRSYYVTRDHTIDQHFDLPSRSGAAVSTGTTIVDFAIDGMSPFANGPDQQSDYVDIFSFGVGYQGQVGDTGHGATTFTRSYDWSEGFGLIGDLPLPEAELGDDLHIFHNRNERIDISGRRFTVSTLRDWFDASAAATVEDATQTSIPGTFTQATDNRTLQIIYSRGAYDSAFPPVGVPFASIYVVAHPWGSDFHWGPTLGALHLDDWSRSTSLSVNHILSYADPLPAGWKRYLVENYNASRYHLVPGTTIPRPLPLSGYARYRELPSGATSFNPALLPPGMVRVEGIDAINGGKVDFDGTSPVTMTWSPVSGSRVYQVYVWRMFANGSQTRSAIAAILYTEATSLDIPAEVFTGGEWFAFVVGATVAPNDYANGELTPNGYPNTFARTPTGMFRLSSNCGNGSIDTGEQCDTAGESATCDVDCSMPQCGDGLRNAAAGEQCDFARNSLGCDSDCTVPMCGDGQHNGALEDCDDGNALDDGNGCSAECRYVNACGDAVVQPYGEECDTGGDSISCDSDCTVAECGDGFLNTAANEQCDAGWNNGEPGGSCDVNCMPTP